MIVRILGEGQYDVADAALERLNELDAALEAAIDNEDDAAFHAALGQLLDGVRSAGVPHDDDDIVASDVILPPADSSIAEVRDLLGDEGLIPG
jgi:hypothetical protein